MPLRPRRIGVTDFVLFGLAAVCLCGWVVVGVGLYRHNLTGWPIWGGGNLGGLAVIFFVAGVARVRRNRGKRRPNRIDIARVLNRLGQASVQLFWTICPFSGSGH